MVEAVVLIHARLHVALGQGVFLYWLFGLF